VEDLANMGVIPATVGTDCTSRSGLGNTNSPRSLRNSADRADLSGSFGNPDRGAEQPSFNAKVRQHAVLARMVGVVEPDRADEVASELLADFGSVGRLLATPSQSLARLTGSSFLAKMFPAARALVLEALHEEVLNVQFDLSKERVRRLVISMFQGATTERLHAIFLDAHFRFIRTECLAKGNWSGVRLNLEMLVERARDVTAAHLVLLHNHPSGVCEPSPKDLLFTRALAKTLPSFQLSLFEHLIVCGSSVFSMRKAGLL
jgi:DNA repair protein RadC